VTYDALIPSFKYCYDDVSPMLLVIEMGAKRNLNVSFPTGISYVYPKLIQIWLACEKNDEDKPFNQKVDGTMCHLHTRF